jgi:GTPase SAR1 family protein
LTGAGGVGKTSLALQVAYNLVELDKPIFTNNNYLFHYLIIGHNLDGLKLSKFPVYIENSDHYNGFHLAAKEYDMDILSYLIETYPEYIYNRNKKREAFTAYLDFEHFSILIGKFPDLDWEELIMTNTGEMLDHIIINLNYSELMKFLKVFRSLFYYKM